MIDYNKLNSSKLVLGLNFGDHEVHPDTIVSQIEKEVENCADMFILRCKPASPLPDEVYVKIATLAKEKGLFFAILYAYQHPPKGKRSHLNKQTVDKITNIAGDLFLGEVFAETGSQSVAQDKGYFEIQNDYETLVKPPQNFPDMASARKYYVEYIKSLLEYNKQIGINGSFMIEPTSIGAYDLEGGIGTLMLEMLPANAEQLVAFTRGATIGHGRKEWGGFVAHEWYGGYVHTDPLKVKRLDLAYKYLYMQGANYIFLESGNTGVDSFGFKYDYDHPVCSHYRDYTAKFYDFVKNNARFSASPCSKVAFIFGDDDGYGAFLGSHTWCQFDKKEWAHGDREKSWQILDEVYKSYSWCEMENVSGDGVDLSNAPAYGSYDVIPVCSPIEVMQKYDYLIFVGHSTMNQILYKKLTTYVENGGILFACACHMYSSSKRTDNNDLFNNGDFSDLFGLKIDGSFCANTGVKFYTNSLVDGLIYPATKNFECDSNYPTGYTNYANVKLCGSKVYARLSDTFDPVKENDPILLTENKLGKGVAMFLTIMDYPGNPTVYPIYKKVVKELLTASHRNAIVKVFGSDKIRFSTCFDNDKINLYLLNTSFDVPNTVGIIYNGKTSYITLEPCQLKSVTL